MAKILGYTDFFPYDSFRPHQERSTQQMSEAVALGKNSILIAANGTGKTIMALAAALPIILNDPKRKILFCARTFTQNARVIQEAKAIIQKFQMQEDFSSFGALSLRGRNEMCPHKVIRRVNPPPSVAMTMCATYRKNRTCKYFNKLMKKRTQKQFENEISNLSTQPLEAQELMGYAEIDGVCPYFLTKMLMAHEKIIVCNYQWIFQPEIRKHFLETIGVGLQDCVIIMDECHNLPEMANGINSFRLTPYSLRQALLDLDKYEIPKEIYNFVQSVKNILEKLSGQVSEETTLDTSRFLQQIMDKNHLAAIENLRELLADLEDYGKAIEQEKIDAGDTPRDHLGTIVELFTHFIEKIEDPAYFACVTTKRGATGDVTIALELKCLSPRLITDPIFKESYATISMSGTLHPYTYTQLLGLHHQDKVLKIIKMAPPFPKQNVKTLLLDHLNTKGNNRTTAMYREILIALKPILLHTPKNVGVFCASYEVVKGLWSAGFDALAIMCEKKAYREQPGLSASDNDIMIDNFKNKIRDHRYEGAVLLGVCGGRNSEGEDFPGDYMNTVVVVGIPFQRPTPSGNALIKYYDSIFPAKGRIFGYTVPALQRANQACGRPIRRMEDRGLIILMDFRYGFYSSYLSDWVQKSLVKISHHPVKVGHEVRKFFGDQS